MSDKESDVLMPFLSDYRSRFHVRQIAELMKMNHATVALAMKKLEMNNIVLYEIEGRNKKYRINLDNISAKSYIENSEKIRKLKYIGKHFLFKKMIAEIDFEETPVILFGSYAKENYNSESDIDIAVIDCDGKKIKEFAEKQKKEMHIQRMTKKNFIVGLKENDALIIEIIKNHIILNNEKFLVDVLWRHYNEVR